jgi:hypothetical protein
VAISQGFRLAFPDELGGMPYDAAELPDQESIQPLAPIPATQTESANVSTTGEPGKPGPVILAPEDKLQKARRPVVLDAGRIQTARTADPEEHHLDEEDPNALLERLYHYLEDNSDAFTDRHTEWIVDKALKAVNREGIIKMFIYAEKVVRNARAKASVLA